MTSADVSGNITGTFSVKDICFGGTYSHDITDRLRGGISIRVFILLMTNTPLLPLRQIWGLTILTLKKICHCRLLLQILAAR